MADPLWMEFESTSGAERQTHQISDKDKLVKPFLFFLSYVKKITFIPSVM